MKMIKTVKTAAVRTTVAIQEDLRARKTYRKALHGIRLVRKVHKVAEKLHTRIDCSAVPFREVAADARPAAWNSRCERIAARTRKRATARLRKLESRRVRAEKAEARAAEILRSIPGMNPA